jgi:hypothetical protein
MEIFGKKVEQIWNKVTKNFLFALFYFFLYFNLRKIKMG